MKNILISNQIILETVKVNRLLAYSLALTLSQQKIEWESVMMIEDMIPEELKHLGVVDDRIYNNLKRKFYRQRNFIINRGMYVEGLEAVDFNYVAVVDNKFVLMFPSKKDRMTWAHDVIAKCGFKTVGEAKPYYMWSTMDKHLGSKLGEYIRQ